MLAIIMNRISRRICTCLDFLEMDLWVWDREAVGDAVAAWPARAVESRPARAGKAADSAGAAYSRLDSPFKVSMVKTVWMNA